MDFSLEMVISHPLISVIAYRLLFFMILAIFQVRLAIFYNCVVADKLFSERSREIERRRLLPNVQVLRAVRFVVTCKLEL